MMVIVSNNPMVERELVDSCVAVEGTPLDVLYHVLDMLASGQYELLAHPIAGNARLLRNPFRTVVCQEKGAHTSSVSLAQQVAYITRAIDKMELIDYGEVPISTFDDYATVDYQLYCGTVQNI